MSAPAPERFMRRALSLARRATGQTSPNPLVGAVLVRRGRVIGEGWHREAGQPHAEIEALQDAEQRSHSPAGATLYVTLEPCSTHGRTPPCTDAILSAGVRRVVVAATDPNPQHAGRGFALLRARGVEVVQGVLTDAATAMNAAFNHWIVHRTPLVTLKAAMTLDGKIASAAGESKWITGPSARRFGHRLRLSADGILVGVETILADDPQLLPRHVPGAGRKLSSGHFRRLVLDSRARTPVDAQVVADPWAGLTTIVVGKSAPVRRVQALERRVRVLRAPVREGRIEIGHLLFQWGGEGITSLLVEGGGEVHASFLMQHLAQRIVWFYAPKVLGGKDARRSVGGAGFDSLARAPRLRQLRWRQMGADLVLAAALEYPAGNI
jgi:diaminohydroxyphosphoribosylaminopyrimidine deaminase/5-amino-6-(5-phosphoribosylamino)uracil reductase